MRSLLSFTIILLLFIPFGLFNQILLNDNSNKLTMTDLSVNNSILSLSPPVSINGNSDFANQSSSEGWPGQGTKMDPYRIQNLNISETTTSLMEIKNTNCHFIIEECYLNGLEDTYYGILFSNVSNALVINTSIEGSYYGAHISDSDSITISNCTFNVEGAETIHHSTKISILNNTLNQEGRYGSENLLLFYNTSESEIRNNRLYYNQSSHSGSGIRSEYSSNNSISHNWLNNLSISLWRSERSHIHNNVGVTSRISLRETNNCTIFENDVFYASLSANSQNNQIIENNFLYGLFIYESGNNIIVNNSSGMDFSISGEELQDYIQLEVTNNSVQGKKIIYWQHKRDEPFPNEVGQVFLINCSSIEVIERDFANVSIGILAVNCSSINIISNNFKFSSVSFSSVNQSNISNNNFTSCDLSIDSSNGVLVEKNLLIENTNAISMVQSQSCTVSNNKIYNSSRGVEIYNCDFIVISNNQIKNNSETGIICQSSNNITVTANNVSNIVEYGMDISGTYDSIINSNTIWNNSGNGLILSFSDRNNLCFNVLHDNIDGIYFSSGCEENNICNNKILRNSGRGITLNSDSSSHYPHDNLISNNMILENAKEGIFLKEAKSNRLLNNTINDNGLSGIYLHKSSKNDISVNSIYQNRAQGLYLSSSSTNIISGNNIYNNFAYGINISTSNKNQIHSNNFVNNNQLGLSQAYDYGSSQDYENVFEENFWDEWTDPDINNDGFVDIPYEIDGEADKTDDFPLTSQALFLSTPIIIQPQNYETISKVIEISWHVSYHSLGEKVTYSIQIIQVEDYFTQSWITIATDLTTIPYLWDSLALVDGNYYLKVTAEAADGLLAGYLVSVAIDNHYLSIPSIISPANEKILTKTIMIEWTAVTDSSGHPIEYDVFISPNGGIVWRIIASGVTATTYLFDTTSVEDGFDYRFKIEGRCSEGLRVQSEEENRNFILNYLNYLFHDPIYIENNSDFENQAMLNGWTGDGSKTSPYVIEGYNITSIVITNSNVHFEIRKCLIHGRDGIILVNVTNGMIEDNTILDAYVGINLYECDGVQVLGNLIFDCDYHGISITASSSSIIEENDLYGNNQVIFFYNSNDITLQRNNISYNMCDNAVHMEHCETIEIFDNILVENINAIYAEYSFEISIQNNNISNNKGEAIIIKSFSPTTGHRISQNFIFNNSENGIYLEHCYQNIISDNIILDNGDTGIYARETGGTQIANNTISKNREGIYLFSNEHDGIFRGAYQIIGNILRDNQEEGLYLQNAYSNIILNNVFENNGMMISGSTVEKCVQSEVRGNLVNNRPIVFGQNETDKKIPQEAAQIFLINCTSIEIAGFEFSNSTAGIVALYCNTLTITSNDMINNEYGLYIDSCEVIQIHNNHLLNNNYGIYVENGGKCTISHNVIRENSHGIYIHVADSSEIFNNLIEFNEFSGVRTSYVEKSSINYNEISRNQGSGIFLDTTSQGTISNNIITDNLYNGIYLIETENCHIESNIIRNNTNFGIRLRQSSNTYITQNNFVKNKEEGDSQCEDNEGENNSFIMNYWDEWTFPDENSDGFIDTPYPIDESSTPDYYPCTNPFHFVSSPILNTLICGQTISGTIEIKWFRCHDSLNHSVSYSLFYSPDNGKSWNTLISETSVTVFSWNTESVSDKDVYLLKIIVTCEMGISETIQTPVTFEIQNHPPPTTTTTTLPSSQTTPTSTSPPTTSSTSQTSSTTLTSSTSVISALTSTTTQPTSATGWQMIIIFMAIGFYVSIRKDRRIK